MLPNENGFTFSKVWIAYAEFLIRREDLSGARKLLGQALGKCPRKKLFKFYIELELQLGEIDRCRKLYERQIQVFSFATESWSKYAAFEAGLGELERARSIFELAISQEELDMPESVWKAYIDFEIEQAQQNDLPDFKRVRDLYTRLLNMTQHVKVWISFAKFEEQDARSFQKARVLYQNAYNHFKDNLPE